MCRNFGAGLYVSEMINARPLVDGRDKTIKLADFGPEESPRSLQLYGSDPYYIAEAVKRLVNEGRIDHLDMNFGCPVPKVTRKGGGAAIPLKAGLLRNIVHAAVQNAGSIPVTIKFRIGINDSYSTFLTAGRVAEEEGCAAVGLHARTAAQLYNGHADWNAIANLKQSVNIPVLGNGDIWEGHDALRMMRQTGCGQKLSDWFGERVAMRSFRRHVSWYTKGFRLTSAIRDGMMRIETVDDLRALFSDVDRSQPFPPSAMRVVRGKATGVQKVSLPAGFLDNLDDDTPSPGADEDAGDGG
jgi:tRNA-dihydrouridine synthase